MTEVKPLTHKQQKIFDFIAKHIETKGYPPTIRDICRAFDIKSPNGVMCHLNALQAKRKINRNEKLSRGITIDGVNAGGYDRGSARPHRGSRRSGAGGRIPHGPANQRRNGR